MAFDIRNKAAGPVEFTFGNTRDEIVVGGDFRVAQAVDVQFVGLPIGRVGALQVAVFVQAFDFSKRAGANRRWDW